MDFKAKRIVWSVPGMDQVAVRRDLEYKTAGDLSLKMDLYLPAGTPDGARLPAVIFVHGDAPWEVLGDAKDWGQYRSWGELAAASGLAAVTFTHRSTARLTRVAEAMSDVTDLVSYVREHAAEFQIDAGRLGLWVCSMGGPVGLTPVLTGAAGEIRCTAALYALADYGPGMLPSGVDAESLRPFSPLAALEQAAGSLPPMLLVRAGLDRPEFNQNIDRFMAAALGRNLDVELINYPAGFHAFDMRNEEERCSQILRRVIGFFQERLG